jgi:hypothetical protein
MTRRKTLPLTTAWLAVVLLVAAAGALASVSAQGPARGQAPAPPPTPKAGAPIDLTGYWVSVVNEDWRWRMVTPPVGDVASVPLNPEGLKVAKSWNPATDGSCLAYGAAGLMRQPTRLHVTWESDTVLKVETDAGVQTRRLVFGAPPAGARRAQPSLQGTSVADWERPARGRGAPVPGVGNLKVVTTNLRAAWLRRNGVPYSEGATLTEYFDRFAVPNGDEWLVVTSIVSDPKYLTQDFVTSTHFKHEADGAKWAPAPCKAA